MIATTVDEQGTRRAVTKLVEGERLVSCTCCSVCCMYPADQLDGNYAAADLPDDVTVNWTGHLTGSASKSGSSYTSGTVTLAVNSGGTAWVLTDTSTTPATTVTVGNCLIIGDGNLTPGNNLVEDQFEDTYTVEKRTETLEGPPDDTFVITRQSLCVWCGYDPQLESEICLEYAPPQFAGQGHWTMGGFGEAAPRNNKSPVGNYNDGGSIWMVLEP